MIASRFPRAVQRAKTPRRPAYAQIVSGGMGCFLLALLLRDPAVASAAVARGLHLCAATVIPSLFPFMILSETLVASGAGEWIGRLLSPLLRPLFRLSVPGCCVAFLGAFCGFPIGARAACAYCDKGLLSKAELEHLLTFCNNPSPAFLTTAVGVSLCGDRRFGILLYVSVLLAAAICGFVFRPARTRRNDEKSPLPARTPIGFNVLPSSVTAAVTAILQVCGFVLFFSAVTGVLTAFFDRLRVVGLWPILLSGTLEMTSGVCAAEAARGILSAALIGLFCGWSGFSVHLQILTGCAGRELSFKRYFVAKALQGFLVSLFCVVGVKLFLPDFPARAHDVFAGSEAACSFGRAASAVGSLTFLLSLLFVICRKIKNK